MSELLLLLVNVVLPVFAVVAVGAWAGRRFGLPLMPINRLALYTAVPALAFRTMLALDADGATTTRLVLAYLLSMLALGVLASVMGRVRFGAAGRTLVGTSVFSNAANLNLPVALFAFGQAGLDRALVLYLVTSLAMFSVGPSLLGRVQDLRGSLLRVLGFPVLWTALLGLLLNALQLTLPLAMTRAVNLLADAAVPLVLLALGVHLASVKGFRPSPRAWWGTGLKLLVAPAIGLLLGTLLQVQGLDLAVLITLLAMPTAVNAAMLAVEFEGDGAGTSEIVVLATGLALLTLPLMLALVGRWVPLG